MRRKVWPLAGHRHGGHWSKAGTSLAIGTDWEGEHCAVARLLTTGRLECGVLLGTRRVVTNCELGVQALWAAVAGLFIPTFALWMLVEAGWKGLRWVVLALGGPAPAVRSVLPLGS